ncbi:MAG: MoaD/ThiS family protein [Deltaproteobacteria bacterium]|jgi:sulfur carrier protein|nr:MoaD/ThiS family protein [Deltaproteobacteria bacterium]
MTLQVQVKLFLHLRKNRNQTVEVTDGSTARDLVRLLGIRLETVGVLSINDRQATLDQQLKDGDIISIIPPIGGG